MANIKEKKNKKPYSSIKYTTGDIQTNIDHFNKELSGKAENNHTSGYLNGTFKNDAAKAATKVGTFASQSPDGASSISTGGESSGGEGGGMGEALELKEAKRYVRRYYIRPQEIFCSNKDEVLKALIDIGESNCSVYTLNNLGGVKDVTKLTNKDIIYYYDDGKLYDKNKVKVMDYDLAIKHEEKRDSINPDKVSDEKFNDVYDDRMTDQTVVESVLKEDVEADQIKVIDDILAGKRYPKKGDRFKTDKGIIDVVDVNIKKNPNAVEGQDIEDIVVKVNKTSADGTQVLAKDRWLRAYDESDPFFELLRQIKTVLNDQNYAKSKNENLKEATNTDSDIQVMKDIHNNVKKFFKNSDIVIDRLRKGVTGLYSIECAIPWDEMSHQEVEDLIAKLKDTFEDYANKNLKDYKIKFFNTKDKYIFIQFLNRENHPSLWKNNKNESLKEDSNMQVASNGGNGCDLLQCLNNFLDDMSIDGYTTTDYSGRFMFGDECIGIVIEGGYRDDLVAYLVENGFKKVLKDMRSDNMGLKMIYYFPGYKCGNGNEFNQDFDDIDVYGEKLREGQEVDGDCCICGEPISGYGNNAEPYAHGRCCDACNLHFVIPARIEQMNNEK